MTTEHLEAEIKDLKTRVKNLESQMSALKLQSEPSADLRRRIVEIVCDAYGISVRDMFARNRTEPIAWARQLAMALFLEPGMVTPDGMTSTEIGKYFGRDHTSVLDGARRVRDRACWRDEGPRIQKVRVLCEQLRTTTDLPSVRESADTLNATKFRQPVAVGSCT